MKVIWKAPLARSYEMAISLPHGAEILTVQVQNGEPVICFLCDPDAIHEQRWFRLYATGQPSSTFDLERYIGTFQLNEEGLVFHLFEPINQR
jgi:hypothetical protein